MGSRRETGVEARGLSIRIFFMWRGMRCRETIKLEPTKANLQYAARLRSEILRKIEFGTFVYSEYFPESPRATLHQRAIPTFSKAAQQWVNSNAHLAKSTRMTYEKHLNKHWLPAFGEKRIDAITYSDIMEHLSLMGVQPKTRNNIIIPIRRILDAAHIDGLIESNPAGRIRNVKAQKPQPDPFTLAEVELILQHMASKYHAQIFNYFEFAFFSGLRTSELIELQWGDIEDKVVIVRRARVEGESKGTKTSQVRIVELNERAKLAITKQQAHTKLAAGHVFMNPFTGEPWNDQRSQSKIYWVPALKALKLHQRKAYQTRHTFATLMLMAGANPMWVARQLGHATMKMTLEVYSKWIDQADKSKEVDKVNSALFSPNSPQEKTGTAES